MAMLVSFTAALSGNHTMLPTKIEKAGTEKIKQKETGVGKGSRACNHLFTRLVLVYQLLVYLLFVQN